jgi:outer membrane receptor for monomeric catechols
MLARTLSLIAVPVVAISLSDGALPLDAGRLRHGPTWSRFANAARCKHNSARTRALAGDHYADSAAPYKANRLSSSRGPIINIPSQTTVITREIMDDKNATTIGEALRGTPGRDGRAIMVRF